MFLFVSQIILILSLGGIIFIMVRKIPVLVTLTESTQTTRRPRKSFFNRVKDLNLARHKEILIDSLKQTAITENKTTRKEEFDKETDYWDKVTDK